MTQLEWIKPIQEGLFRKAVRYGFYPLLVFGSLGVFMALMPSFPGEKLARLTATIAIVNIVIIHVFERLAPYRREWNDPRGDRLSNFLFTNVILPVLSKSVEIFLSFVVLGIGSRYLSPLHALWPSHWNLLGQLALALLICEFGFYWVHRWGHTIESLWNFHAFHHSPERLYWDNSGRFHPVDLSLNWLFYFFPLFLFGVPAEVMAMFLTINAVTGLLEHANVDFNAGFLNYIFNTAQLHRWHHSIEPKISSTNFGKVLTVWDLVFGTHHLPKGEEVGVIGVFDPEAPKRTLAQLAYPFKKMRRAARERKSARTGTTSLRVRI